MDKLKITDHTFSVVGRTVFAKRVIHHDYKIRILVRQSEKVVL